MGRPVSYILLLAVLLSLASCHKKLGLTTIAVEDSVRHYPPIVLGDELTMVFLLENTGDEMLVLTDMQPACPTIEVSSLNVTTVPPGGIIPLKFSFHSDKNLGYTQHIIRLFGNIAPHGHAELIFDTNVVRPSTDLSDYEEYYQRNLQTGKERIMDGRYGDKGYFSDSINIKK